MGNLLVLAAAVAIIVVLLLLLHPWALANSPDGQDTVAGQRTATPLAQRDGRPMPTLPPGLVSTPTPAAKTTAPIPPVKTGNAVAPLVNAEQIVVLDEDSGAVLYSKNERQRTPMASVTKICTALIALEKGNLKDQVKVAYDPAQLVDSTMMGILPGETYTLEDLLYGLLLPSGNDAALAIASHIAKSEPAFVTLMNAKAAELGLADTRFANPHGLDSPEHYSTAYDIAALARNAMANATFRKIVATTFWDVNGTKSFRVTNRNRLLGSYPGADGVKIGFTEGAGRTTVASATRNGHRVYVVFMHGQDIVTDVVPLLDYAFDNFRWPGSTPTPVAR